VWVARVEARLATDEHDKADSALPAGLEAAYAHHVEDQIEAASCAIVVMPPPARPPEYELWHPLNDLDDASGEEQSKYFEPQMLEPMQGDPSAGRVSLGVWICWVLTNGGTKLVRTDDRVAWVKAVAKVRPYLTKFQLSKTKIIHLKDEDEIALLNKVEIVSPYDFRPNDVFQSSDSYIQCAAHFGDDAFNDKLFSYGEPRPAATDHTVAKSDILGQWPRRMQTVEQDGTTNNGSLDAPPVAVPIILAAKRAAVMKALKEMKIRSREEIRLRGWKATAKAMIDAEYDFLEVHYPKKQGTDSLVKMLKDTSPFHFDAS
jgi:hypothetical protein